MNPVGIFGPALGKDLSASIELTSYLMNGRMPGCPRIKTGLVDVRDVADLHLRAMLNPAAKGERFLALLSEAFRAKLRDSYPALKILNYRLFRSGLR